MDTSSSLSWIGLVPAGIFAVLWWLTPPDREYETVDLWRVRVKTAFGWCALICGGAWVLIQFQVLGR